MERLGRDVLAVLDALNLSRINWCGLSMGGMVGQWLGANAPERIERLVLTNTSSYFADKTAWNDRLKLVREKGIPAFAPANMERWVTKGFRERSPDAVAWLQGTFAATPTPVARFWAMPGSIAPMPTGMGLTPSGRTSAPAAPGARSGRDRISTSARAACSSSAP